MTGADAIDPTRNGPSQRPMPRIAFRALLIAAGSSVSVLAISVGPMSSDADGIPPDLVPHLIADLTILSTTISSLWSAQEHHRPPFDAGVVTSGSGVPVPWGWRLNVYLSWALTIALTQSAIATVALQLASRSPGGSLAFASASAPQHWLFFARLATEALATTAVAGALCASRSRTLRTATLFVTAMLLWRGHQLFPLASLGTGFNVSERLLSADEGARSSLLWGPAMAAAFVAVGVVAAWLGSSAVPLSPHRSTRRE